MFGAALKKELAWHFRKLWRWALAMLVLAALGCLIVLLDKNPVEATGTVMGIACLIISAIGLTISEIVVAILSFRKGIVAEERELSPRKLFFSKWLAFLIVVFAFTLVVFLCTLSFAWEGVWNALLSMKTEWAYFVETAIYIPVVTSAFLLVPTALFAVFRAPQKRGRNLMGLLGGLVLFLAFGSIVMEILLLIHSPTTDMGSLWGATIAILAVCALGDVGAFSLICRANVAPANDTQK